MSIRSLPAERWLLPDGVQELLPDEALRLEELRRRVLDTFAAWGYQQVVPPFIEFLDSLLTGTGHDLESLTYKLIDPVSGRLLGVRADMTPQVARIDAHTLKRQGPVRLSYAGTVLHAYPDPLTASRSPMQAGAELFGHAALSADLEVIRLMLETLAQAGVLEVHLDLGHVGIYRNLALQAGLDQEDEAALFAILQRKSRPDLEEFLANGPIDAKVQAMILALVDLNGSFEVLEQAKKVLVGARGEVMNALEGLESTAMKLQRLFPGLPIHFDLAELRGYHYHTGLVFAALVPGFGKEIARGGRYDAIGRVFGQPRPAVGFSTDLKSLLRLGSVFETLEKRRVMAPPGEDPDLLEKISQLRHEGWQVVQLLPGQDDNPDELECDYHLVLHEEVWTVLPLNEPC